MQRARAESQQPLGIRAKRAPLALWQMFRFKMLPFVQISLCSQISLLSILREDTFEFSAREASGAWYFSTKPSSGMQA